MNRPRSFSALAMLAVLALVSVAHAQQEAGSKKHETDPGNLGAHFWQLVASLPPAVNPFLDETKCQVGQREPTWFLYSTAPLSETIGNPTEAHCTIPTGTRIFLALTTAFCFREPTQTLKDIQQECAQGLEAPQVLRLEIDGKDHSELIERRSSDRPFTMGLPDENVFGLPAGFIRVVHDGYYAILPTLEPGDHTVVVQAAITLEDGTPIAFDTVHLLQIVQPAARLELAP
jgi:hypothetical protein